MSITQEQLRGLVTKTYLKKYDEIVGAPSFLQSMFVKTFSVAKEIHFEVRRGNETISVDISRGVEGTRNTFSKSSEKAIIPPYYNETFESTALEGYNRVFGESAEVNGTNMGNLASNIAYKYLTVEDKVRRARELQAANVLEDGILTLSDGTIIDYKRKANSKRDTSGSAPWSTAASDVAAQILQDIEFIRTEGKNGAKTFNMIASTKVILALQGTTFFTNKANFNTDNVNLVDFGFPNGTPYGATLVGKFVVGTNIVFIWGYDETYTNAAGATVKYLDETKYILMPTTGVRLEMAHGGVPAVTGSGDNAMPVIKKGEFVRMDYMDFRKKARVFETSSAPVAIPVTVDMIVTRKVLV